MADAFRSTGTGTINDGSKEAYSQYYLDPKMVRGMAQTLGGVQQGAASQYLPFIQNPTAHPLYQAQIGGLLQSLQPSEDRARTALTDQFRAAGGLRSGAYGREGTMLEGELMNRRSQTASALLGQMFPQITQALQSPMNQTSSLINALKLNYGTGQPGSQFGSGSGWENIPPSMGLNTPMYGDNSPTTMNPQQIAMAGGQSSQPTGPTLSELLKLLGGGGGSGTDYGKNYVYGPATSLGNSASGATNNGLLGYGQAYDEYGYTNQDWANDPYYND